MISSFADKATEDIFEKRSSKKSRKLLPFGLHTIAKRKLNLIAAAVKLKDLKAPPGNRLEAL